MISAAKIGDYDRMLNALEHVESNLSVDDVDGVSEGICVGCRMDGLIDTCGSLCLIIDYSTVMMMISVLLELFITFIAVYF